MSLPENTTTIRQRVYPD